MDSVYNKREEQRLRYRWYLKFANDAGEKTLTGQMFDISSRSMAFLCHCDDNCPKPDELISTRFGVPYFDSGDSFDLIFFNRTGRVCRVDDLSSRVRRVAIQFAKPLFFKPGEQDISESEAQRRLNAQKHARTEAERAMRTEAGEKTRFHVETINRSKDEFEAERAARLKAEEEAQTNSAIAIKAQEQAASYARARDRAEKTAETESKARAQAEQGLRSEIEARVEAEEQLKAAIGEHSRIKAQAAEETAAIKSEMSEAIGAAESEVQKEAELHAETINRLKDEFEAERAARLKAEEDAQTNSAIAIKAQEQAASYARARDRAEKTAETESKARAQAEQGLRSEIEARVETEEQLKVAIGEHSRIKAQAAKETAAIKSEMSEAIETAESEAQKEAEFHAETINWLKDEFEAERAARLKAEKEAQTNRAITIKAQEKAASYAHARDRARRIAKDESKARSQAEQHLRYEIEARVKTEGKLKIFDTYNAYDDIPSAKRAWVAIKAKLQSKYPRMVYAGIKAKMARGSTEKNKPVKNDPAKKVGKKKQSIYEQLNLSDYKSYEDIPPAKKAWITIKAKQQGKDPGEVHARIERKMGGGKGKKKTTTTRAPEKKTTPCKGTKKTHLYSMGQGITRTPESEKKGLAGFAVNIGTKCDNDCLYCSTGAMLRMNRSFKQFGRDPFGFGYAIIDPDKPSKVARNAKNMRKRGLIELCSTTDAWCPSARKYDLGRKCLEAVLNEEDWSVRVLTKNHEVENDFDLIRKYRDRVLVGLSITATPDKSKIMQVVEINASPVKERMRVMRKAHRQGLRTYAMLGPLLPGIADSPEQIDSYIQFAESIGAEEIFSNAVYRRGKSIILTQQALEEAGYAKEARAVEAIRNQKNWSEYTFQLIRNLQRSIRKYSSIRKLRFLLYPSGLLPEHIRAIRKDDAGIKWLG